MFDDNLFEYLLATDQIDDVLGTKTEKGKKQVLKPKLKVVKNDKEIKNKEVKKKNKKN